MEDAVRESVRAHAARLWQEPVRVLQLGGLSLRYRVPGRKRDGTVREKIGLNAEGCVAVVVTALFIVPNLIALAAEAVFAFVGYLLFSWMDDVVRGKRNCAALSFADAARKAQLRGQLFFVWSHSYVGLMLENPQTPELTMVWSVQGADRPQLDLLPKRLHWADGSYVTLSPGRQECRRFETQQGF